MRERKARMLTKNRRIIKHVTKRLQYTNKFESHKQATENPAKLRLDMNQVKIDVFPDMGNTDL